MFTWWMYLIVLIVVFIMINVTWRRAYITFEQDYDIMMKPIIVHTHAIGVNDGVQIVLDTIDNYRLKKITEEEFNANLRIYRRGYRPAKLERNDDNFTNGTILEKPPNNQASDR